MKNVLLAMAFISAMTLAIPLWAQEAGTCPEGQQYDDAQKKCVPEQGGA